MASFIIPPARSAVQRPPRRRAAPHAGPPGWPARDLVTSLLVIMVFPFLAAALFALAADRILGAHVFDVTTGGPMLWQHLFWFFGHPEVYMRISTTCCSARSCSRCSRGSTSGGPSQRGV
jgi:hypothetical protein